MQTDNDRSQPAQLSNSSNRHPVSSLPNSTVSLASSSRRTLLTASLLARLRLSSNNRLGSRALADRMVSQAPQALFLATDSHPHRLAMACLPTVLLLAKVSKVLLLLPAHSPRTTSPCQLARLASRDLLTCRAQVKDPSAMEASKVHRNPRLLKRLRRRMLRQITSLSRCPALQFPRTRLRPLLLHRRSSLSRLPPLPPHLLRRLRSKPNRSPRRSRQTAALLFRLRPMPHQSPLLPDRQQRRRRTHLSHSPRHTSMPRTPLLPPSLRPWLSLDLRASSSNSNSSLRLA